MSAHIYVQSMFYLTRRNMRYLTHRQVIRTNIYQKHAPISPLLHLYGYIPVKYPSPAHLSVFPALKHHLKKEQVCYSCNMEEFFVKIEEVELKKKKKNTRK